MFSQLDTPIPLKTPKGKAWAVAVIDYGPQWDLQWVTFVKETGECWTFRNSEIRQEENFTFGLPKPSPVKHSDEGILHRPPVPFPNQPAAEMRSLQPNYFSDEKAHATNGNGFHSAGQELTLNKNYYPERAAN